MKLRPLFDRVLIQREEIKAKSIIIPDAAKERNAPHRGVVVAIGPTCEHKPPINVGDRVVFGMHAGTTLKVEDVETYVVAEADIIAVAE
jgi:co-chaperonin GroES (HSP10)